MLLVMDDISYQIEFMTLSDFPHRENNPFDFYASGECGNQTLTELCQKINSPLLHIYAAFQKERKKNIKRKKNIYGHSLAPHLYELDLFFFPLSNHGPALSSN